MAFSPRVLLILAAVGGLLTGSWCFDHRNDNCCPEGWTQLNERCFIYDDHDFNFLTAETVCIILGGNLVSIHSTMENTLVRQLIFQRTGENNPTWIGFTDAVVEDSFIWTDGSIVDFTNFGNNRPNNNGNQDCAIINFRGEDTWNDIRCNRRRPFVCARDVKHSH
ncbi:galactose-specific lectin nattectin-like [Nerophis ophidion]|uniref:galactose-specific lectin nattectin-like n=1 Tax=Nerophis ophidion TaxID=159077 RepID=UPI002AE0832F|nr:galactose-specific lectin nattectin-like [Nerophis ophidion]